MLPPEIEQIRQVRICLREKSGNAAVIVVLLAQVQRLEQERFSRIELSLLQVLASYHLQRLIRTPGGTFSSCANLSAMTKASLKPPN